MLEVFMILHESVKILRICEMYHLYPATRFNESINSRSLATQMSLTITRSFNKNYPLEVMDF